MNTFAAIGTGYLGLLLAALAFLWRVSRTPATSTSDAWIQAEARLGIAQLEEFLEGVRYG